MVVNNLIYSKQDDVSVEILDFRDTEIRNLFIELTPDKALQKLKSQDERENFTGISRPFKLITIPNQDDIDYFIKGNNASKNRWDIWEKLLSESNLNLEIVVLLTGSLPEYKISRNKLFMPEILTEKRIRIIWASSSNGIYWSPEFQNYPSALLHWKSESLLDANFEALLKPFTLPEVFDHIFNSTKSGEIYNIGLRQAAFGSGYKKETDDILYEATKFITGAGNIYSTQSNTFPKLEIDDLYRGNLYPAIPGFNQGIFFDIDNVERLSVRMCQLFGATNSIVSKDQIPSIPRRLEKSYKEYISDILNFVKSLKKVHNSLKNLLGTIDANDGFNEEEYNQVIDQHIDLHTSKPKVTTNLKPIRVTTAIFQDILDGIKNGHNIMEYKILVKKLIDNIKPNNPESTKLNFSKIWEPITKNGGVLDNTRDFNHLEREVKSMFGNRIFKFMFNLPWSLVERKKIIALYLVVITTLLSIFWGISSFIAGEPGDDPIFRSSGSVWLDSFVTNLFRNTPWSQILIDLLMLFGLITLILFIISKYIINKIERVGRKLEIAQFPEIIRDSKVFLWKTIINDWVLASDRNEVICYLEAIHEVLGSIQNLLLEKYYENIEADDATFHSRHLEPNPKLEVNLNSVSENGVYKDFEGSVKIIKSDLLSLLELSFHQEWMKIRGAAGKNHVPNRIIENYKESLTEFEKRIINNPALDPKTALSIKGREEREKFLRNLWSEGDYPREQVLNLMELDENSELVHFMNSDEVSLLVGRTESLVYFRYAPIVLDLPNYSNFIRSKDSKVAGVMRLIPMSLVIDYLRISQHSKIEEMSL